VAIAGEIFSLHPLALSLADGNQLDIQATNNPPPREMLTNTTGVLLTNSMDHSSSTAGRGVMMGSKAFNLFCI
jgi:hypothetical protein